MSGNGLVSVIRRLLDSDDERRRRTPSPFETLRQQMFDVLGDGGILKDLPHYSFLPLNSPHSLLSVHYSGFLEYSDQPFETTTHLKFPRMMKLGRDVTLSGLELGLLTMRKGEFSRLLLQPQYGYGPMGCPPLIPPQSVILYEVHVLDFLDSGQVDDFISMSPPEQNKVPLSTLLEVVITLRNFGNRFFAQSRYFNAKDRYKQAVMLLVNREVQSDVETERIQTALLPLYLNLSVTELRLDRPNKALKYGLKALDIDAHNTKALFRCGQAYLELREYERAQRCLVSAQAKKPFDSDINKLLRKVMTCYKDSLDKERILYSKMFTDFRAK